MAVCGAELWTPQSTAAPSLSSPSLLRYRRPSADPIFCPPLLSVSLLRPSSMPPEAGGGEAREFGSGIWEMVAQRGAVRLWVEFWVVGIVSTDRPVPYFSAGLFGGLDSVAEVTLGFSTFSYRGSLGGM